MGIYSRYKKDQHGFRKLVELLETTPLARRQKMIDAGMAEDPAYTETALRYLMKFEDLYELGPMEMAELVSRVPGKTTGFAIVGLGEDIRKKFLSNMPHAALVDYKENEDVKPSAGDISIARSKLVLAARELERGGKIKLKAIPTHFE